jgi:hypothetical protein
MSKLDPNTNLPKNDPPKTVNTGNSSKMKLPGQGNWSNKGVDVSPYAANKPSTDPRPFDTSWGDQYTPERMSQETWRAHQQGFLGEATSGTIAGIGAGLGLTTEYFGYVLDMANNIALLRGFEVAEDNWLSEKGRNFKEASRERFPIYKKDPGSLFNASDSASYFEAFSMLQEQAIGFGVPGGAISRGLGLAGKGLSWLARANKYSKAFMAAEAAAPYIQAGAGGYIMNIGESKMMALETYDQTYNDLFYNKGLPRELAREKAGEAARNMYLANKAFVASDMFSMAFLGRGKTAARSLIKETDMMSKFQRYKKALGTFGPDDLIAQGLTEYGEEIAQNLISNEAQYRATVDAGVEPEGQSAYLGARLFNNAFSGQAQFEGILGFFGGAGQRITADITASLGPGRQKQMENLRQRYELQKEQLKQNEKFIGSKMLEFKEYQELMKEAAALSDEALMESIDDMVFTRLATENFRRGTTENLEKVMKDRIKILSSEKNLEPELQEELEKLTKYSSQLKKMERQWRKDSRYGDEQLQSQVFFTRNGLDNINKMITSKEAEVSQMELENESPAIIQDKKDEIEALSKQRDVLSEAYKEFTSKEYAFNFTKEKKKAIKEKVKEQKEKQKVALKKERKRKLENLFKRAKNTVKTVKEKSKETLESVKEKTTNLGQKTKSAFNQIKGENINAQQTTPQEQPTTEVEEEFVPPQGPVSTENTQEETPQQQTPEQVSPTEIPKVPVKDTKEHKKLSHIKDEFPGLFENTVDTKVNVDKLHEKFGENSMFPDKDQIEEASLSSKSFSDVGTGSFLMFNFKMKDGTHRQEMFFIGDNLQGKLGNLEDVDRLENVLYDTIQKLRANKKAIIHKRYDPLTEAELGSLRKGDVIFNKETGEVYLILDRYYDTTGNERYLYMKKRESDGPIEFERPIVYSFTFSKDLRMFKRGDKKFESEYTATQIMNNMSLHFSDFTTSKDEHGKNGMLYKEVSLEDLNEEFLESLPDKENIAEIVVIEQQGVDHEGYPIGRIRITRKNGKSEIENNALFKLEESVEGMEWNDFTTFKHVYKARKQRIKEKINGKIPLNAREKLIFEEIKDEIVNEIEIEREAGSSEQLNLFGQEDGQKPYKDGVPQVPKGNTVRAKVFDIVFKDIKDLVDGTPKLNKDKVYDKYDAVFFMFPEKDAVDKVFIDTSKESLNPSIQEITLFFLMKDGSYKTAVVKGSENFEAEMKYFSQLSLLEDVYYEAIQEMKKDPQRLKFYGDILSKKELSDLKKGDIIFSHESNAVYIILNKHYLENGEEVYTYAKKDYNNRDPFIKTVKVKNFKTIPQLSFFKRDKETLQKEALKDYSFPFSLFASSKKAAEKGQGVYKLVPFEDIDWELSGLEDFPLNEIKKVIVLQQRGLNADGIPVGTVRIITDKGAENFEVFFKPKKEAQTSNETTLTNLKEGSAEATLAKKALKDHSVPFKFTTSKKRVRKEGGVYKELNFNEIDLEASGLDALEDIDNLRKVVVVEQVGYNRDGVLIMIVNIITDDFAMHKIPVMMKPSSGLNNSTQLEESIEETEVKTQEEEVAEKVDNSEPIVMVGEVTATEPAKVTSMSLDSILTGPTISKVFAQPVLENGVVLLNEENFVERKAGDHINSRHIFEFDIFGEKGEMGIATYHPSINKEMSEQQNLIDTLYDYDGNIEQGVWEVDTPARFSKVGNTWQLQSKGVLVDSAITDSNTSSAAIREDKMRAEQMNTAIDELFNLLGDNTDAMPAVDNRKLIKVTQAAVKLFTVAGEHFLSIDEEFNFDDFGSFYQVVSYINENVERDKFEKVFDKIKRFYTATFEVSPELSIQIRDTKYSDILGEGSYSEEFVKQIENLRISAIPNEMLTEEKVNKYEEIILKLINAGRKQPLHDTRFSSVMVSLKSDTGVSKVAYQSRPFEVTSSEGEKAQIRILSMEEEDSLNEDYIFLLDPNNVNVGTSIQFRVVDDPSIKTYIPLDEEKKETTWGDLKKRIENGELDGLYGLTDRNALIDAFMPIEIVKEDGGQRIGFVHTVDWINPHNVYLFNNEDGSLPSVEDYGRERMNMLSQRRRIIREGYTTGSIRERGEGMYTFAKQWQTIDKITPNNSDLQFTVYRGEGEWRGEGKPSATDRTKKAFGDGEDFTEGHLFAYNRTGMFPVIPEFLNDDQIFSVLNAVRIYFESKKGDLNEDLQSTVDAIKNTMNLDITDANGFKEYLSIFLYNFNPNEVFDNFQEAGFRSSLEAFLNMHMGSIDSDVKFFNVTDNGFNFGEGRSSKVKSITASTPESMMTRLMKELAITLSKTRTNINATWLNQNIDTPVVMITQDGFLETINSYREYVRKHVITSLDIHNTEDGTALFKIQPTLKYNLSKPQPLLETTQEETGFAEEVKPSHFVTGPNYVKDTKANWTRVQKYMRDFESYSTEELIDMKSSETSKLKKEAIDQLIEIRGTDQTTEEVFNKKEEVRFEAGEQLGISMKKTTVNRRKRKKKPSSDSLPAARSRVLNVQNKCKK